MIAGTLSARAGVESDISDARNHIAAWIATTAPAGTAVAVDWIAPLPAFDHVEERTVRKAVERRRNEFRAGRRLAREALSKLGCPACSLPPDHDRLPQWPLGFLGTISHSGNLCAVHVGRVCQLAGIGVDIERLHHMGSTLRALICRPDEIECASMDYDVDTLLRFVAKEALYKACFPVTREFLTFHDVRIRFDSAHESFNAQLMRPSSSRVNGCRNARGGIAIVDGYVVASVCIAR
jgi:4'-phosphopantetheinyl transferase EntD